LASSIESKMDSLTPGKASAVVWTEKPYSKWLEVGTSKIEPRPFMTPALEQNRERFPKALGAAVVKDIDGAVKK
jgi:HK97 gp10 family phage protein